MGVNDEYVNKAKAELGDLADAGVVMSGNAFSPVLLVKGEPEEAGVKLLAGPDGDALRAALPELEVLVSTENRDPYTYL